MPDRNCPGIALMRILVAVVAVWIFTSDVASGQDTITPGIDERTGNSLPGHLSFFDETGVKYSAGQFTDRPAIVSLVYYGCKSRCPLLLGNLAGALGDLDTDPESYRVITLSFDDRDTPEAAAQMKRNYIKAIGRPFPEDSWRFLTADKNNINEFTRALGFKFREEKNGFSHPRALVFLSPGGTVVRYLYGMTFSTFDIKMSLLEASGKKSLFSPERLTLLCFRFDPGENKYVFNLARSLAVAVLGLVFSISLILILRRRGGVK